MEGTGTGSSTLAYDPLDRMTQMVGTLGARYLYDGDEIAGVVVASTGTTIANRIVRGPWPDELLAAYQGNTASTPLWSLQDHQSSIIAITDAAGTAPYTLGYDEYGQPRSGNAGRLMYTGQLWMPDFGLYHYKARAYHPGLGRFMQTDPVGYEQGMNLYAYVGLDPVNATDPGGMVCELVGSSYRCAVKPGRANGPEEEWARENGMRLVKNAYEQTINTLAQGDQSRSVTVNLEDQSFNVTAGEAVQILAAATVIVHGNQSGQGDTSRGFAWGGNQAPRRDGEKQIHITNMGYSNPSLSLSAQVRQTMETIVHESFHLHRNQPAAPSRREHTGEYNRQARRLLRW